MNKTSTFSSHSVIRYFIVFLSSVITVTASIGFAYFITIKSLENNLRESNQNTAIQMKDIIEERIKKVTTTIYYIGSYHQTNYLLNLKVPLADGEPMNMIYAREYIDYLERTRLSNDLISEISVYSLSNDSVYTQKGVKSLNSWYSKSFGDYSVSSIDNYRELLRGSTPDKLYPQVIYYSSGVPTEVIPLIQKLPLGSKKKNIGNVCILISCNTLFQGFLDSQSYGNFYITDNAFNILYANKEIQVTMDTEDISDDTQTGSFIKKIDGEKQIAAYARSDNGLLYITVTPYSRVMSQVHLFRSIFYVMIAFSVIACIFAAVLFLRRINQPVKNLLNDNEDLNQRLMEQTRQVQVSILCRLLTGFFSSKQEINLSLNLVGIDVSDKVYSAAHIVIQKDDKHELANYPTIKAHIMEFTRDKNLYAIDTGLDCISLIFSFSDTDIHHNSKKILSTINDIQAYLSDYKVSILTGCGSFYEDITQIRNSYMEAVIAVKSRISFSEDSIFWYSDHNLIPMYYYPLELEQRILISTRCGDNTSIEEALEEIYLENYIKTKIPDNMSDLLLMKIKTTLLTACSEIHTLDETLYKDTLAFIFSPVEKLPTDEIYYTIRTRFKAICEITSMSQTIKNNQLKQNILDYIDDHFQDSDLCLSKVADSFHISEAYLSSFFKEQTGINFITYIETKRLTKACSLLKERSFTIDAIAKTVGYSSAHSFRRAFKRNYGISPANYNN